MAGIISNLFSVNYENFVRIFRLCNTNYFIRLETYGNQTSRKTKTAMARECHGRFKKAENWMEAAKDRKTWRDLLRRRKPTKVCSAK
jgi:hypothetical protein